MGERIKEGGIMNWMTCKKCGQSRITFDPETGFHTDHQECKGTVEGLNDRAAKYQYLNNQTRAAADARVKREQKENQE